MKMFSLVFLCLFVSLARADSFTNTEGKTIDGDLIMVSNGTVRMYINKKEFTFPLEKLNAESQAKAIAQSKEMSDHAAERMEFPIISDMALALIWRFYPDKAEGKSYLVEGDVTEIIGSTGLAKTPESSVRIKFSSGMVSAFDFSGIAKGDRQKIEITKEMVALTEHDGTSKRDVLSVLAEVGSPFPFLAKIRGGEIQIAGVPSEVDYLEAEMEYAKLTGGSVEDVKRHYKIVARIKFLKNALDGNAGTALIQNEIGAQRAITLHYSEAEKQAMTDEINLLEAELKTLQKGN